jgi:hypothetical protein
MRKALGILVLLLTLAACGSTTKTSAPKATTPKVVTTPKATSAPTTTAAPKPKTGQAVVQWVYRHPTEVAGDCKASADALATGNVTDAQVAKAEVDGWNSGTSGLDGALVMGVIATRCDPKTGAALIAGLTQLP